MEKKFTRAMVCEEFKSTCGKCPLHSGNNPKSLPCWLLGESDIQDIMKDYPYADVKIRIIFNDIETRLTKLESYVKPEVVFDVEKMKVLGDEIGIISGSYVDEKLYDKLEAKHEADCRLISEYDLDIKRLEKTCNYLYVELNTEQKERLKCEDIIKDLRFDVEKAKDWEKRYKELEYLYEKKDAENNNLEDKYRRHNAELKSRLFDLKNVENERDHYKGLYSSKCDDYDRLLEKQLKTEKEAGLNYKNLFHSLNHKHQKLVGEHKRCEEELKAATDNERYLRERVNKAEKLNEKYDEELAAIKNAPRANTYDYAELMSKYKDLEEKLENSDKTRTALETENKTLSETLKTVARHRDELSSECYLARLGLKTIKEKLEKTIEAKDREIGLLRAELDKFMNNEDNDYDDRWID